MIFGYFTLFVALTISAIAEYYSIIGLTAIFSAAFWPVVIMGAALGVGKLTATVWLKMHWERASWAYKLYLVPSVAILMILTSLGCFGFLSKAHSDQSLVSGDSMAKVAIYDEKIKTAKDNIDANRKALKQMDEAVDQVMGRSADEKGADKAVAIRRGQAKERTRLLSEITAEQKVIAQLSEERAPFAAEFRKVESEVGPIKYIAALVYGDNPDSGILEKAVRLVIILIVAVLDPLALVLVLAGQQSIRWAREEKNSSVEDKGEVGKAATADIESLTQEVTVDQQTTDEPEQSIFVKHPYLLRPYDHFKNLVPMPSKSDNTIMDDVAAMSIVPPEEVEHVETRTFTQEEADALDLIPDAELIDRFDENLAQEVPQILTLGIDEVERPGDYVTPPEQEWTGPMKEVIEEHVDPNTRIKTFNHRWVPDMSPQADNVVAGEQVHADFGTVFPEKPERSDMYVRVDFLPPRLFKYNGTKWMEVDKSMTDSYYSEEYVKHLIEKINNGEYSVDDLSDSEQDHIREYLSKV
jgi:hypothetical protein